VLQWYRRLFSRRFEGYLRLEELDGHLEELRAYLLTVIEHRQGVGSVKKEKGKKMEGKRKNDDHIICNESPAKKIKKPVRVWIDGCFDMMHFGHANALRQAREMGDVLVVGVHNDEEVLKNKGPPVMNEEERYAAVAACKWVDEVVKNAPYTTQLETLEEYNIDFVVHGDDITTNADGTDCYHLVKQAGKFRECKRTQGISTTELVGRMLLCSKTHLQPLKTDSRLGAVKSDELAPFSKGTAISHFLPTSKKIVQFSEGREPKEGDRVVYVNGAFDLFHIGHIEFLKRAKAEGDYLLVGVLDDQVVNRVKGSNFPIMNLHERVLGVLSCRFVDEVIIGAPFSVTKDVLEKVYKISTVVHGGTEIDLDVDGSDPYELPKKLGIFKKIENPGSSLTSKDLIKRILDNRVKYEEPI